MLAATSASTPLRSVQPRALAISSNLDALLEHEERVRRSVQKPLAQESQVLSSPVSPGNGSVGRACFGGGLPPPPRGGRGARSPRSPTGVGHVATEAVKDGGGQQQPEGQWSSSRTNPYINPAPPLEIDEDGHGKTEESGEAGRPSERRNASQRSHSTRLPDSRSLVRLFSDPVPSSPAALKKQLLRQPRRTKHRHPRNGPGEYPSVRTGQAMAFEESVVLDIRRFSSDTGRGDARRRRPLNSHGGSRRTSSGSEMTVKEGESDTDSVSFIEFASPTTPTAPALPVPAVPAPPRPSPMLLTRSSPDDPSKPIFSIPHALKPSSTRPGPPLPPTTNFLDMGERSDLVKKSRKLARVFGETPGGDMLASPEPPGRRPKQRLALDTEALQQHTHSHASRRYSIPVTPDELSESFHHVLLQSAAYKATLRGRAREPSSEAARHLADAHKNELGSRVSFIDLSDEEDVDDEAVSPIIFAPNPAAIGSQRPPSPSQLSLFEAMTPEQRAEEQRRRNREKLAKLHRFLGSRVPADLVLGIGSQESSLPPIQPTMSADDSDSPRQWLRRRRSSSAGALPSWSDDVDRMKEELNNKEKAINVRRAQKMEKMFGVAPPQTLYHTRHSPSPSVPPEVYSKRSKPPPKPSFGGFIPPGEVPSPTYQQRNPNRSSYIKRPKKTDRPNTAESSRRLLPEGSDCYNYNDSPVHSQSGLRSSLVYHHYQHSLKSLGDILDRDDKESLAELHQYLNDYDDSNPSSSPIRETTPLTKDRRLSNASSMKSERRRSLPARTSVLSISSEYSATSPKPEVSDFQVRRRRAAKLTQFFGVNYRELINDVLESLETGLEHERKRGTLRAEELEDLLERLRKIKMNRKGFF